MPATGTLMGSLVGVVRLREVLNLSKRISSALVGKGLVLMGTRRGSCLPSYTQNTADVYERPGAALITRFTNS